MTRIAIDVDDTLYPFCELARNTIADRAAEDGDEILMRGAYAPWHEWRSPTDVMGLDRWKAIIAACHDPATILAQKPYDDAADVLHELAANGFEFTYISDRSPEAAEVTKLWITAHFPHDETTKFLMQRMEVKSPFIADCQYMIDDRPKNLVDFVYDVDWHTGANISLLESNPHRHGFGLLYEHNRALTDVPGVSLAPNWKLLRQYMVDKGLISDPDFVTGLGQALFDVHARTERCDQGCCIHSPSEHSMREFPTSWRSDRRMMERICPHGIGHPDPDHLAYVAWADGDEAAYYEGVHGCDGCCS